MSQYLFPYIFRKSFCKDLRSYPWNNTSKIENILHLHLCKVSLKLFVRVFIAINVTFTTNIVCLKALWFCDKNSSYHQCWGLEDLMLASTEEILSVISSQTRLHSKLFIAAFFWKIALKLDEWLHTKDYQT